MKYLFCAKASEVVQISTTKFDRIETFGVYLFQDGQYNYKNAQISGYEKNSHFFLGKLNENTNSDGSFRPDWRGLQRANFEDILSYVY